MVGQPLRMHDGPRAFSAGASVCIVNSEQFSAVLTISACFCGRVSFLIAASRCMASLCVSNISLYTSVTGPRPRVYFAPFPLLCAASRAVRSFVQPQYSVSSAQRST